MQQGQLRNEFRESSTVPAVSRKQIVLGWTFFNPDKVFCLGFHKNMPSYSRASLSNHSLGICFLDKHWQMTTLPTPFSKEVPVTRSGDSCL